MDNKPSVSKQPKNQSTLEVRSYTAYNIMIKSWRHKGLKRFFDTGDKSGVPSKHIKVLSLLLFQLSSAVKPEDMNTPGNSFHQLTGNLKEFYSLKVNKNWRIIFRFEGFHAYDVDYTDYH